MTGFELRYVSIPLCLKDRSEIYPKPVWSRSRSLLISNQSRQLASNPKPKTEATSLIQTWILEWKTKRCACCLLDCVQDKSPCETLAEIVFHCKFSFSNILRFWVFFWMWEVVYVVLCFWTQDQTGFLADSTGTVTGTIQDRRSTLCRSDLWKGM